MHIFINGKKLAAEEGETILAVARRNGIEIPTLCHHEALEPVGACRLCMVEITHESWGGWKGLVTACLYPVEEGLEVTTDNEAVHRHRQTVLDLLLARCPDSKVIRDLAAEHGEITSYEEWVDGSKCIMCYLCVRACEAMGRSAISAVNRGTTKEIAPPFHARADACIGCGSCAAVCPTGHIEMTDTETTRRIWDREFEFVLCEGCGAPTITVEHRDYVVSKGEVPAGYYDKCSACKKKELAGHFDRVGS